MASDIHNSCEPILKGIFFSCIARLCSQNGGTLGFGGYNHPLRGSKGTLWEGGVRAQTVLWGGVVQKKGYVNDGLLHAVDWFPSLISMAGGNTGM